MFKNLFLICKKSHDEKTWLKYDWNKGKFFKFCDVSITWSDMHWLTSVSNIFYIIFLQTAKFDINVTLLWPWRSFDARSQDTIDREIPHLVYPHLVY